MGFQIAANWILYTVDDLPNDPLDCSIQSSKRASLVNNWKSFIPFRLIKIILDCSQDILAFDVNGKADLLKW